MFQKSVLFTCLLLCYSMLLQAQSIIELRHSGGIYFHYGLKTEGETDIPISLGDRQFTGLIIETATKESLEDFQVAEVDGEFMKVTVDEHSPSKIGYKSNLIYFSSLINSIELKRTIESDEVVYLHFINAYGDGNAAPIPHQRQKNQSCEKPEMVKIEYWRSGLPSPSDAPVAHEYRHVVVHHTDGSNEPDDYVQVIRSIYIQHTQVNGWNDIGYNFLIAGDGTIFEGRDPQGVADITDIRGAHFCAKNTGTLGVGVMGRFVSQTPNKEAIESLKHLTTWAMTKQSLHPEESFPHPTASSDPLSTFVGHRDGCATECPGTAFYQMLPEVATAISQKIDGCLSSRSSLAVHSFQLYPNPSRGIFQVEVQQLDHQFQEFKLYTFSGQPIAEGTIATETQQHEFDFSHLQSGLYMLCFLPSTTAGNCQKVVIQ